MIDSKSDEIIQLLSEGKSSKEIIARGHKPGTVYSAQRKWRQRKATNTLKKDIPKSDQPPQSDSISEIETDPEIVQLKREVRKAELERQLGKMKVPLEMEILVAAAYDLGQQKRDTCSCEDDGLCRLWAWSRADEIPKGSGEPIFEDKGTWRIKPSPLYCALCTGSVAKELKDLDQSLDSIPIRGIRERFTCECGAKGMLAVSIKCTKCGEESWWGWWPKQQ